MKNLKLFSFGNYIFYSQAVDIKFFFSMKFFLFKSWKKYLKHFFARWTFPQLFVNSEYLIFFAINPNAYYLRNNAVIKFIIMNTPRSENSKSLYHFCVNYSIIGCINGHWRKRENQEKYMMTNVPQRGEGVYQRGPYRGIHKLKREEWMHCCHGMGWIVESQNLESNLPKTLTAIAEQPNFTS